MALSMHQDKINICNDKGTESPPRVVQAAELFGERREVLIELDGVRYRLRITRRGRLILQK
jgi:hemin uptake protein HemP